MQKTMKTDKYAHIAFHAFIGTIFKLKLLKVHDLLLLRTSFNDLKWWKIIPKNKEHSVIK